MAKTKISEYDAVAANNTDVDGINIAEGCPPSSINNAIREVMAHLKDFQAGTSADNLTVTGTLTSSNSLAVTGGLTLDGSAGTTGQVIVSAGSGNTPTWGNAFVAGMIMMWSGSIASIPSGWYLCDGTNGTPNLTDRMVVGAGNTYAVDATGGSNTATTSSSGTGSTSTSSVTVSRDGWGTSGGTVGTVSSGRLVVGSGIAEIAEGLESLRSSGNNLTTGSHSHTGPAHTHTVDTRSPYYALAFIMKG